MVLRECPIASGYSAAAEHPEATGHSRRTGRTIRPHSPLLIDEPRAPTTACILRPQNNQKQSDIPAELSDLTPPLLNDDPRARTAACILRPQNNRKQSGIPAEL